MNILEMNPLETQLFTVVGSPISHSVAAQLYNHLFDLNNINAIMFPKEIKEEELERYFDACRLMKFHGAILTMPLKGTAAAYIDEIDDIAKHFHSVNCVRFDGNKITGHGFDGTGVVIAFDKAGVDLKGKEIMMIGAGGVGGIFAAELAGRGIGKLTILNRTLDHAQRIVDELHEIFGIQASCCELTTANACQVAGTADIFLQATSQGMRGKEDYKDFSFIDHLSADSWVMDAVSNPPETNLIKYARARQLHTLVGLDMLVGQMEAIFEFLLNFKLDDASKKAARDYYGQLLQDKP